MEQIIKSVNSLFGAALQNYYMYRCLFTGPDGNSNFEANRCKHIAIFRRQVTWKMKSALAYKILLALNKYGILLPYGSHTVMSASKTKEEPHYEKKAVEIIKIDEDTDDEQNRDNPDAPRLPLTTANAPGPNAEAGGKQSKDPRSFRGLRLALSPNAWMEVVKPEAGTEVYGANFFGIISLISFLVTRHPRVLTVDPSLWKEMNEYGKISIEGEEDPPITPDYYTASFSFCERHKRKMDDVGYFWFSLDQVISILLTNRPGFNEHEQKKVLDEREQAVVQDAVNQFRWEHYQRALKNENEFTQVDRFGRRIVHKVDSWNKHPEYLGQLLDPDWVPPKRKNNNDDDDDDDEDDVDVSA